MNKSILYLIPILMVSVCNESKAFEDKVAKSFMGLYEVKQGVLAHDRGWFGGNREGFGPDYNFELMFNSPNFLRKIWSPNPILGLTQTSTGGSSLYYGGLTWDFKLSEKWFGTIDKRGNLGERVYPVEPEQTEPREKTVFRDVPQDAIYMAWLMSPRLDKNYYNSDLISDILSNGESSRLYQTLIKKKKMFSDINAFISGDIDKGRFIVTGKLMNGVKMEDAEQAIDEELKKISEELVSDEEYEKVLNKIEAGLVFSKLSVLNKAMNLAYYEMLGDAGMFNRELENYGSVT